MEEDGRSWRHSITMTNSKIMGVSFDTSFKMKLKFMPRCYEKDTSLKNNARDLFWIINSN